jgi:site-specific recombinase
MSFPLGMLITLTTYIGRYLMFLPEMRGVSLSDGVLQITCPQKSVSQHHTLNEYEMA